MADDLMDFFVVKAAIADTGILPADHINFELRDISTNIKTIETFDIELRSGIMVKCDVAQLDMTQQ